MGRCQAAGRHQKAHRSRNCRLWVVGCTVFGSRSAFERWLDRPLLALAGRSPRERLAGRRGRAEIYRMLMRIEYGVYT